MTALSGQENQPRPKSSAIWPWLSIVGSVVLGVVTYFIEQDSLADLGRPGSPVVTYLWPCSFLGFQVVGAMLFSAGIRNRIAVLLMMIGAGVFVNVATIAYARQTLVVDPGSLPFGDVVGWLGAWTLAPGLGVIPLLLLLFPTGRPFSRRWRPAVWLASAGVIALTAWQMVAPVEVAGGPADMPRFHNPFGISTLGSIADSVTVKIGMTLVIAGFIGAASIVWRIRRGNATERLQLKVLIYSVVMLPFIIVGSTIVGERLGTGVSDIFMVLGFLVGFNGIAAAIGLAIVRYKLYEFDVVVNRTLVYGVLTAALVASYLLIVVILSRLLDPVTRDSDIAVAASTLTVAALFRPLRSRIQGFIDRRFYRSKYDAGRAVAMFAARLRDEIEVDTVRSDVLSVVGETLQPSHASLWIRPEATS